MMRIKNELMILHKRYTAYLMFFFLVLNISILGYKYNDMFLLMELKEFQANINGIILTTYFIWFVGIMSILTIKDTLYRNKTRQESIAYYLYHLFMTLGLIMTLQLIIHLFLSIRVSDSFRLLMTLFLFNAIYYFILIVFTLIIKNVIRKKNTSYYIMTALFIYGFIIVPIIKINSTRNIFIEMITWFDLNHLFGQLYLFISSNVMHLPFKYSHYSESFFHYLAINQLNDYDYYRFYLHKDINYSFLTLLIMLIGLVCGYTGLKALNKKRI